MILMFYKITPYLSSLFILKLDGTGEGRQRGLSMALLSWQHAAPSMMPYVLRIPHWRAHF